MGTKRITVIGLGFVGLPLSLSFAMKGYPVTGLDVNEELVEGLNQGVTHCLEMHRGRSAAEILRDALTEGNFKATTSYEEAAADSDTFIITVGLPVKTGTPSLGFLEDSINSLGKVLKKGDMVLVRSTVVPGTTEEKVLPILERKSGLIAGVDFFLGYSSERIAEGAAFDEFENMPTVVGGINKESAEKAAAVLRLISNAEIYIASDIKVVETAKVLENVSRDVNIAMANQFAEFCQALEIDTVETFKIANTHKRVNLLMPGPGVGGYCLPNAYYYLRPKQLDLGLDLPLLQIARSVNDDVPKRVAGKVVDLLHQEGKWTADSEIAVLGLSMKDYSNDDRISPAHTVCEILVNKGARVRAFDPVVGTAAAYSVGSLTDAVSKADALVVLARQKEFEDLHLEVIKGLMAERPVLVDTKHLFSRKQAEELGFRAFFI